MTLSLRMSVKHCKGLNLNVTVSGMLAGAASAAAGCIAYLVGCRGQGASDLPS
jgi:hypothetical protein